MSTRMPAWAKVAVSLATAAASTVMIGAAPAEAAGPDCGPTIYKSNGAPWVCTFADDFNGTALDRSKWHVQETRTSGFTLGGECFVDNANNIKVGSGQLSLILKKSSTAKTCYSPRGNFKTKWTSGSISTFGGFSQTYGRFEWRATFPDSKKTGQQSALWMWPVRDTYGPWPYSGEIDVAEWYGKYWDRAIPFLKYGGMYTDPNATNNYCLIALGKPHTFVLDWNTFGLTISYDDKVCLKNEHWLPAGMMTPTPFDQPFMVAMTQILGSGENKPPAWGAVSSSTMKVDWIRVWS